MTTTDEQLREIAEKLVLGMRGESSCHCDNENDFECFLCQDYDAIFQALLDLRQQVRKEVVEECAKTAESLVGQENRNPTYGPQGSHSYLIASAIRKLNGEGGRP